MRTANEDGMNGPLGRRELYPEINPEASGRFQVGQGHALYWETCGDADAPPIAVLHGGPGGGSSPAMRRFFDPARWRIILYDQRGCGRSTPRSSLEENTTWRLVEDLEKLRETLGVERWALFGGSWGSTLALAYAEAHPERVTGLILRGVFLMTPQEIDWFYRGGAGAILPEAWERFLAPVPQDARADPVAAYYALLTGEDARKRAAAARAWTSWESEALSPRERVSALRRPTDGGSIDALARIECHYFQHQGFLKSPTQLLDDAAKLARTPIHIVQGRYDLVTPPRAAWTLANALASARLEIIPDGGHAASDPGIVDGLVRATDALADTLV